MSEQTPLTNPSPPASRWRLWIDGCGGFLLLDGDQWSVGGVSDREPADVGVRADWPRNAGTIRRQEDEYFWVESRRSDPMLVDDGQILPIPGSAVMTFTKPSPLCGSAKLSLKHPHRFVEHVDGVLLFSGALLIGPEKDCHIRSSRVDERVVLARRDANWVARVGLTGEFTQLSLGERLTLPSITMTLETA